MPNARPRSAAREELLDHAGVLRGEQARRRALHEPGCDHQGRGRGEPTAALATTKPTSPISMIRPRP